MLTSVCIKFLTKFASELDGNEETVEDIRKKFVRSCKAAKGKDHRLVSKFSRQSQK